jgi:hypothetical protein
MNTIFFEADISDDKRRELMYAGELFVFSPRPSSRALCEFAREMVCNAFHSAEPAMAQYELSSEEYTSILSELKPRFVHHPESTSLVKALLADLGCDLAQTYIDVPRLKSIPSDNAHRSGLTFAIHPHRDTWYSAPFCQLNWWIPVYDLDASSGLAFHPRYWSTPVRNSSGGFNHYRWNKYGRKAAATQTDAYVQGQPVPEETIDVQQQIVPITPAGGILLFSGAQLHSAVPNTSGKTRFSIDFRTLHLQDAHDKRGAPNIDSAATGTTLRDFRRGTDLAPMPDDIVKLYDDETIADGEVIFQAPKP